MMKMKIKENDYDEDSDEDNDWKDIYLLMSYPQYIHGLYDMCYCCTCCHQYSSCINVLTKLYYYNLYSIFYNEYIFMNTKDC